MLTSCLLDLIAKVRSLFFDRRPATNDRQEARGQERGWAGQGGDCTSTQEDIGGARASGGARRVREGGPAPGRRERDREETEERTEDGRERDREETEDRGQRTEDREQAQRAEEDGAGPASPARA